MIREKVLPLHHLTDVQSSGKADLASHYVNSSSDSQWQEVTHANVACEAVGIESRQWFVAIVGTNTEISCRDRLLAKGYEVWVATSYETRICRNGRKRVSERVVIPLILFVHATKEERREIVSYPFVKKFMTDRAQQANSFGVHPLAVIPDHEMKMLQFLLYQSSDPVRFLSRPLHQGSAIRVVRGSLRGFEGLVARYKDGDSFLVANIGILGCAMVKISLSDIESLT